MKVVKPTTISTIGGSITRASVAYYWNLSKVMTSAAINEVRFNYNPDTSAFEGVMIEGASTNLLLNSETLSTQTCSISTATQYTVSFYGAGSITLSGGYSSVISGTGTYKKTVLTFTSTSTSLTLTVSGSVKYAQLETGAVSTSWISTTSTATTRAAEVTTGSGLLYTSLTDANPVWSVSTTYLIGVTVQYLGRLYESLQGSNVGKTPIAEPTWWLDVGPTNQTAVFDSQISTVSTATTQMTIVVRAGTIDSVALVNMQAQIARLAVLDSTTGSKELRTAGLTGSSVYDWYQYFFFDPLLSRTQVLFTSLPSYNNPYITLQLEGNPGDTVSLALAAFGLVEDLGGTQYGATAGIIDYSVKTTDEFGTPTFVKRNFSKRLSGQLFIENLKLNRAHRFLSSIRATPVVWVATDDPRMDEALVVYGFYKEFSIDIAYPNFSLCSIEIEGLT